MDLNQITVAFTDYEQSVRFYLALGLKLIVDSPEHYARFETKAGTTLSISAASARDRSADTVVYFEVDNVDSSVQQLSAKGLVFDSEPVDQPWLWREAFLRDPAGNRICIYHAGDNRRHPPWRVGGKSASTAD